MGARRPRGVGLSAGPAHYACLTAVEEAAWAMLSEGASSRHVAFHQATVATVARDGAASLRTVVLRAADRDRLTLRFHTDRRSEKAVELAADPRLAIHFYDHDAKVQVRARGRATMHRGDALAGELWATMRDFSKACYRQPAGPGEALCGPDQADAGGPLDDAVAFTNFVPVTVNVDVLEWLYLAAAGHRRARVCYRPAAERTWLAP